MRERVGALVGPVAAEDVGVDVPLGVRAHPAPRRRPARLPVVVHDLRPGRRRAPHRLRHPRPRTSTRSGSRPAPCTPPSARPRTTPSAPTRTPTGRRVDLRAQDRRRLPRVPGPAAQGRRHGLRRPAHGHGRSCSAAQPDVLEHYQQRFQHVLVDEYQDTNTVQNELVLLLGGRAPQRLRRGRQRPVPAARHDGVDARPAPCRSSRSQVGDDVLGTGGDRRWSPATVTDVQRGRYDGPAVPRRGRRPRRCRARRTTSCSPGPTLDADGWLVYLMYRADRGYRIGRRSVRPRGSRRRHRVRRRPGARRRLWILRCATAPRRVLGGVVRRRATGCRPRASTASAERSR